MRTLLEGDRLCGSAEARLASTTGIAPQLLSLHQAPSPAVSLALMAPVYPALPTDRIHCSFSSRAVGLPDLCALPLHCPSARNQRVEAAASRLGEGVGGTVQRPRGELEPEPEPEPGERGGGWCSVWLQWPLSQEGKGSSSQKLSLLGRMTLSWGRMYSSLANEWTGGQAGTARSQEASR